MKHLPSVAVDPSAATGVRRGDGGRPISDTRELTRVGIRTHAGLITKAVMEDDWDAVRINARVIVGLLEEEGL